MDKKKLKSFFGAILFQASFPFMLFGAPGDIETWTGFQDTDITNPNNWNFFTVPTIGTEGFFDNTASNFNPTLSATSISPTFHIDLVQIDTTMLSPGQYSFFIQDNTIWNFEGSFFNPAGVQVTDRARNINGTPVAPVQNFYINNGGSVNWFKLSEADIGFTSTDYSLPPFIVYNLGNAGTAGFMSFNDTSGAGSASYVVQNGSQLLFNFFSNGEIAQISVSGPTSLVNFNTSSSAGGAIINAVNSRVLFNGEATASSAAINLNNSTLSFTQASNVYSATITATNGSTIDLQDATITTGVATINMTDSTLTVRGNADTGHLDLTASNSQITFHDTARESGPGRWLLSNNSSVSFSDSSDAGLVNITADNSTVTFGNFSNVFSNSNSDRSIVTLNNNSVLTFNNSANLQSLFVLDTESQTNFNNFLTTPMLFGPTAVIINGIININPFGPSAAGPVTFRNSYDTYVSGTVYRGTLTGNTLNIVGNWTNNGVIIFDQSSSQNAFSGTIQGPGSVMVQGGGRLILASANTISASAIQLSGIETVLQTAPGNIQGDIFIGNGSYVDFEVHKGDTQTYGGLIAGNVPPTQLEIAINETLIEGTVVLSNPNNSYTGETRVYSGTLQLSNASSISGVLNILAAGTAIFNQTTDGAFKGTLQGAGVVSKNGSGKLAYPANISSQVGAFFLQQGSLQLDGSLICSNFVSSVGTTLSGSGSLTSTVDINGTLSPGDPATFTIFGDLTLTPNSTFQVSVDGEDNTQVNVLASPEPNPTTAFLDEDGDGDIIIENGAAQVILVNGAFDPNKTYTILSAEGALTGQFASTTINDPLLRAIITYDAQHAYLQATPVILLIGQTFNQKQVAKQLNIGSRTNPEVASLIMLLSTLPGKQAQKALSQMSGEQYTQVFVSAERVNQNFIRRLYDPLRPMVTSTACNANPCCGDLYSTWMDISFDRSYSEGNKNARGYRSSGYEISLGIQTTLNPCWTLGLAGFYENDHLHFNIGGSGKNNTGLGALYALYRPQNFYVLANLLAGYSNQHVRRPIDVLNMSLKGHPHIFQGSFYGEIGFDLDRYLGLGCFPWLSLLNIQPFFGLEADYFHLDRIREKQSSFLALHVKEKSESAASSRLGVHFTTKQMCCLSLSVDMAWQCRLSSLNHRNRESFITFGDEFTIKGIPLDRNSADGTINVSMDIFRGWSIYAEAAGQKWENASSYNLLLGVLGVW